MRESLNEPVSVIWYYSAKSKQMKPYLLDWNNQQFKLGKVDFWHKTWLGKYLVHHFSVADEAGQAYFKLAFDTSSLEWVIEEYMYGQDTSVSYGRG